MNEIKMRRALRLVGAVYQGKRKRKSRGAADAPANAPPICHPRRRQVANGLCGACYQREWLRKHPGKRFTYGRRHAERDYVTYRERQRWNKIKAQYGLTRAEFEKMWTDQLGLCPVCLLALELGPVGLRTKGERWKQYLPANNPRSVTVDHDHVTRKVRGLLCRQHNAALALFGDNVDYLNRAIEYLVRSRAVATNTPQ